jgi:lipopolysaccharide transport system permease protein
VYFPRIIVPLAASLAGIVDFFFALLVFIALLFFFQIVPTLLGILLFLPMLLVSLVAMAGLGMIFAAVNVKYRDVRHALPFVIQLMLFLTPVIYPVSLVPERFQWLLYLNPMTGVISTMRSLILHDPAPPTSLVALSIGVAVAFFVVGLIYFRKREREFADIV